MCAMGTGDSELDRLVAQWLEWDKDEVTRSEIKKLFEQGDVDHLRKLLSLRMEFGTAGLRAEMGAGFSRMNDLTIIQTTQGFAKYMLRATPDVVDKGVMIGYDSRHKSRRFAELVATVFLNEGLPVFMFSEICPTPFVPYTVRKLQLCWGVMVTASHNPKQDNGYKVYYRNGAQIIGPHDKGISKSINENLEPLPASWDTRSLADRIKNPYEDILNEYIKDTTLLSFTKELNAQTPLKFTYTAMHGVGYKVVVKAFEAFNFRPCIPVEEQVHPDPEFPTVKYPNPEEGKNVLNLSMETADRNNSTIILANDPDADRLALAEKQPDGKWRQLSGNEVGGLLGWWLVAGPAVKEAKKNYNGDDVYTLASTVSSRILKTITEKEGFKYEDTLTGFKWMGNKSYDLITAGKTVLFAFEEAIGFMCGTTVLDKDGISAAMVCAEMAVWLHTQGKTIAQQLETIYQDYGYHISMNSYFICHEPDIIKAIFEQIRHYGGTGTYPEYCGEFKIQDIRDLTTGYDSSQPDKKTTLPSSKSSQMITFTFANGCIVTMRTSGTEPKIKYYSEMIADPAQGRTREAVTEELKRVVDAVKKYFYEPEKNKLTPPGC